MLNAFNAHTLHKDTGTDLQGTMQPCELSCTCTSIVAASLGPLSACQCSTGAERGRGYKLIVSFDVVTFEVDKAKVLSSEVLDDLDPIDHDRSTKDVRENEDVNLLKGFPRLVGKGNHRRPVLSQLLLVKTKTLCVGLTKLRLFPSAKEPTEPHEHHGYISQHDRYTQTDKI